MISRSSAPLVVVSALVAYGSLYPFKFVAPPSLEAALLAMLNGASWWTSRGDVAGNTLLFIPIGIAIVIAASSKDARSVRMIGWWTAAVLFSLTLQILQNYFPPRMAGLADVLWNAIGTTIGIAVGVGLRTTLARWSVDCRSSPAVLVLACWFGWRLWPFVPTLDWQHVKNALKPLLMQPAFSGWSFAATALSLALLAAVLPSMRHPQWMLAIIAVANLLARPFLAGQLITITLLSGTVIGLLTGSILLRAGVSRAGPALLVLVILWGSVDGLRPFAFSDVPGRLHWVPFAALLQGAMDINLASLCGAAFITGALMLLGERMRYPLRIWCIALTLWVTTLEILQLWLPTRTADLTVGLLPLGWWLMLRFTRRAANK